MFWYVVGYTVLFMVVAVFFVAMFTYLRIAKRVLEEQDESAEKSYSGVLYSSEEDRLP